MKTPGRMCCAVTLMLVVASGAAAGPVHAAPTPALAPKAPSRLAAMRAIAIAEDERRFGDGELKRLLAHPDATVRRRAVLAVGRLQDSTTVPALTARVADASPYVREDAVFALGQVGHRSARPTLEALLGPRTPIALRMLAVEALGKLGDKAATPRITGLLGAPEATLRGEAAIALWRLADSTAIDSLLRHHADPDPQVRWKVIYALEKIVDPDRIVLPVALHANDPAWLVRAYTARTLGRQKSARATAYLLQMLTDATPAVVVNALRGLQFIADSTCASCLPDIAQTLGHADPYVRVSAATALADRFAWVSADSALQGAVTDSLAGRLADPDAATRGAAARALIARTGTAAVTAVQPMLDDPSLYTRVAVLQALATLPAARVVPLLSPRTATSHALFERMTAAEALGTLRAPEALALLRGGLADTSVLYVASAAAALAELGDSASVPALTRAYTERAQDADADARIALRDALRQLAGAPFADSLERAHVKPPARASYATDFQQPSPVRGAILHTTKGEIEWAFYREDAVQTVKNFVRLAERGYFDGLSVHRVVPNFVIQDGDPTGTGSGGPGYSIRCEYNQRRYEPGMVGMALSGKDTGGSQWFITHSPQPHLNGRYTIFAHVTRGMDVVERIVQGDRVTRVVLLK